MPTLYLTEQNSLIRKTSDRLVVVKDGETLAEIPCLHLDAVMIYGNVQFTTQALVEMLDHGIEMAIFTLSGRLRGQLTPPKAKNVPLRMRQYELAQSQAFCLEVSREIVRAKIASSVAHLRRFRANHPEAIEGAAVEELARLGQRALASASLEELRGVEGTASRRYFALLAGMVPPELGFAGRNRRPPRDPVNALLSFGYVLVGNELQALLDGIGFDPYLGFYHQLDYGRPSLALDLLEEMRPSLVDRLTVKLVNRGTLGAADFVSTPERGLYLSREALKRYFAAYEEELNARRRLGDDELSYRELFRRQAQRLAKALAGEAPYRSFELPC